MYDALQTQRRSPDFTLANRKSVRLRKPGAFERKLVSGQNLFRQGDRAHGMYEVVSGVVCLSRVLEDGRRQVIGFGYPGDFVGFPSDGRHHTDCDVIASGLAIAHKRSLLEDGQANPGLHKHLLDAALREICGMQDHCLMLGQKSALEKTASFLAALTDRIGVPLGKYTLVKIPMCRADIADYLGLTTETVSRTFSQLRDDGIIELEDSRTMIVLQPGALCDASMTD